MAHKREMARDTLYLAVHNFDRAVALEQDHSSNKQVEVLSLLSLWMASKVSEHRPISLKMLPMCVTTSSFDELLEEERRILKQLSWKLQAVTPDAFLHLYLQPFAAFLDRPAFQKQPVAGHEVVQISWNLLDLLLFLPKLSLLRPQAVAFSAILAAYCYAVQIKSGKRVEIDSAMKLFNNFLKLQSKALDPSLETEIRAAMLEINRFEAPLIK